MQFHHRGVLAYAMKQGRQRNNQREWKEKMRLWCKPFIIWPIFKTLKALLHFNKQVTMIS